MSRRLQDVIFWVCFLVLGTILSFAAEAYIQTDFLSTKPPVIATPHFDIGEVPAVTRINCVAAEGDDIPFDRNRFESCLLKGYPIGGDIIMPYDDSYLGADKIRRIR